MEKKIKEVPSSIEKTCKKCNNPLTEGNDFCSKCGTKYKTKKQIKLSTTNIIILSSCCTLVLCLLLSFGLYMFLNNNESHINTNNKTVTIKDNGLSTAVNKVYDSVVVIENHVKGQVYATGSGFVFKTKGNYGYILTNSHVLTNAEEAYVMFTNKEKIKAEVVGIDEYSDIAVLKVAKKYVLQVAIIGKNKNMSIGDTTFAIGAPLDSNTYSWSVTRGILSGKDRVVGSGTSYMNVLQTDTPINSGNSGGPLCNANGEVIGITNMKLASDQIEGMGFAIPIETAIKYANSYITGKDVRRPYIGLAIYDSNTSFFSNKTYIVVEQVEEDSAADDAGIKAGDVITKINGTEVENSSYFKYKLYSYSIGDTIKITVDRNGKEKTFKVKLESNSKST